MKKETNDLKLLKNTNVLLTLGGEDSTPDFVNHVLENRTLPTDFARTRSNKTIFLSKLRQNYDGQFNIILSGGFERDGLVEAISMEQYVRPRVNDRHHIYLDKSSLDTIGNIYFSRDTIRSLTSKEQEKTVGLVTDPYHMERSVFIAKTILGPEYTVIPFETDKSSSFAASIGETAILKVIESDFKYFEVNHETIDDYMRQIHPMHNAEAPNSNYKTLLMSSRFKDRIIKKEE
jgi:uncharacterized SAM-binding protein YcdF (DUF218 family)